MNDDDAFLRAIQAAPVDSAPRLVYADWLEERGDSRAEYLRLAARLASAPVGGETGAADRRRIVELRDHIPPAWLAILGDHRCTSETDQPDPPLPDGVLGQPDRYVDDAGYERTVTATALHGLTGALAYVECRSQWRADFLDIRYDLHLRDRDGRTAAWEVETYNPAFGCDVRFLGWYGDAALMIYQEKHQTYVCRFGLDAPAAVRAVEHQWVLDGRHLAYRGYAETDVRRLAIPGLDELPLLSAEEAGRWELLPP